MLAAGYMMGEMAVDGFNAIFGPSKPKPVYHANAAGEGFDLGGEPIYQDGKGKTWKYDAKTDEMEAYKPGEKSFFEKAGNYLKGKALKTWGKANGNMVAYYKGYSIENGYDWNDEGINIVGIRNESVSQKGVTTKDDYFLVIRDNKPVGLYFGSADPGKASWSIDGETSADYGGVAHLPPGRYPYAMDYSDKRQSYILRPTQDVMVNRDQNADGVMSMQEQNEFWGGAGRTILFHFGGQESYGVGKEVALPNGTKERELFIEPGKVNGISVGCQVISGSFFYDLEGNEPIVYTKSEIKEKGNDRFYGAYQDFIDEMGAGKNVNYVLMNSADSANSFNKAFATARNTSINAYLEQYRSAAQKKYPNATIKLKSYAP